MVTSDGGVVPIDVLGKFRVILSHRRQGGVGICIEPRSDPCRMLEGVESWL